MTRRLTIAALAAAVACAIFATFGSASVNVAQSGWSWGNPTPQGNTLSSIDFVQGRGFAAGAAGTVLRTDDGGGTWTGLATGTASDLTRLQVLDPDTVTVLGGDGCVLRRTDDAGTTFHKIFIVTEKNCAGPVDAFTFVDRQVGYLLVRGGNVFRTVDAGQTFSRQTAIPGTEASNNPTGNRAVDIAFTSADKGIAFVQPPNGAPTIAFATTDAGNSWKPVDGVDPGSVRRVWFLDAQNGFAVGQNTLLATTDGGTTWKSKPGAGGQDLTSIRCVDPKTCLLTTVKGDKLLRTTDGGATVTEITPSSQGIFAAGFASATRVAAVGASGTTVVSDDGGVNYTPISTDLGLTFTRLRPGPSPSSIWAVGPRGSLGFTLDGGATWHDDGVPTSRDMVDVSFSIPSTGYALDAAGGLFKSTNAGGTWQTLDTGTTATPAGLSSPSPDVVVLVGPRGIRRGSGSNQPQPVGNATVRRAPLDRINSHPGLLVAYGSFGKYIFVSTDKGQTWKTVRLPKKVRVGSGPSGAADFVSRKAGFVVDSKTRLWRTKNSGRTWEQVLSVGSSDVNGISMASPTSGFIPLESFRQSTQETAHLLRTSDGGKTWRPQAIARGTLADAVATGPLQGYVLVQDNHLFFTNSGGDAGNPTALSLKTPKNSFTKRALKKAKGRVTVTGTLPGAVGGEQVVVSRRDLRGSGWSHQLVTAGANGGSFTTSWTIKRSSVFVAQWSGDSGRRGAGSVPLAISVQR